MPLISALLLAAQAVSAAPMTYPDITGETVAENDRIIAQHFIVEPGQSTGMHQHSCSQMEILLSTGKGEVVVPAAEGAAEKRTLLDMKKGDLRAIEPSPERHNFVNVDSRPIEWILLTFKGTCQPAAGAAAVQADQ